MIKPRKVIAQKNFFIVVHFDNGKISNIDMSFILNEQGPVVDPLKTWEIFQQVEIIDDVITWPTGYDIDPNFLVELAS